VQAQLQPEVDGEIRLGQIRGVIRC
jgi:hypothetical protein